MEPAMARRHASLSVCRACSAAEARPEWECALPCHRRWLPTAFFAVFMLSWFASRMYYFPAYVIRSVYYEPINVRIGPGRASSLFSRCCRVVARAAEPACMHELCLWCGSMGCCGHVCLA